MAGINFDVKVTPKLKNIIKIIRGDITKVNKVFAEKLLDEVELTQIHGYVSDGNPSQPGGSTYKRTFTLRKSSKRKIGRVTFKNIPAQWSTDLDYAPFVLGSKDQQAGIHIGRWKSTEEVATSVNKKIDDIYSESWHEVIK